MNVEMMRNVHSDPVMTSPQPMLDQHSPTGTSIPRGQGGRFWSALTRRPPAPISFHTTSLLARADEVVECFARQTTRKTKRRQYLVGTLRQVRLRRCV